MKVIMICSHTSLENTAAALPMFNDSFKGISSMLRIMRVIIGPFAKQQALLKSNVSADSTENNFKYLFMKIFLHVLHVVVNTSVKFGNN